jgi:hypothetical protein
MNNLRLKYCINKVTDFFESAQIEVWFFYAHSRGSENICKDKCKNVKTSYSAYAALVRSFQAESAKIRGTLCKRYRQQFAFSIPWCNDRADN